MHDVIIVGGGTAGCVLAERLTVSGELKVLLLEAGGEPASPFVGIPAGFAKLFRSKLDWAFESEPQAFAGGRRIFIPRGRMLGGCSNMNAQIHQWCHPADYEGWVAAGAHGWGWEDVEPVFRAQERWVGEGGARNRGRDGPMIVSPNANLHATSGDFVAAARAAGLAGPDDYNGGPFEGAWPAQIAHSRGRRFSAYDAFLKPALGRPNLEVAAETHAVRILIADGRASGVVVRHSGAERRYDARHGVVLAAGAFGSPQLLMLSGIGPVDGLERFAVPIVRESPDVGANLQDHPLVAVVFSTRRTDTMKNAESPGSLLKYLLFKRGMLASNAVEAIAFARSQGAAPAPDIELLFAPFEWRNQGLEAPSVHALSIGAAVVAPLSRGRVSLRSADPLVPPAIDLGMFADSDGVDAAAMVAGIRLARKVAATAPLSEACSHEIDPGPALQTDAQLRSWIHSRLQTVYHPAGTCRMGADARAVVDPQLRVAGLRGLWVADASVMPSVPRGHPNAVVAMIAQRAAAMIVAGLRAGT